MGDNHGGCKIALWNARSIRGKLIEFREKIREYDLMGVTETWLTPKDSFKIKEYNVYRKDRESTKRRGGIGIAIKKDIKMKVREDVRWVQGKTEIMAVTLYIEEREMDVILVYKNPNYTLSKEEWRKLFLNRRDNIETIIMGDMNASNKLWSCQKNNRDGDLLAERIEEEDLFVVNEYTTSRTGSGKYRPSNIDLIIATFDVYQGADIIEEGEPLGSDHQVIGMQINRRLMRGDKKGFTTRKFKKDKTDWREFKLYQIREEENLKRRIDGCRTVEEKYEMFTNNIREAMTKAYTERRENDDNNGNGEEKRNRRGKDPRSRK